VGDAAARRDGEAGARAVAQGRPRARLAAPPPQDGHAPELLMTVFTMPCDETDWDSERESFCCIYSPAVASFLWPDVNSYSFILHKRRDKSYKFCTSQCRSYLLHVTSVERVQFLKELGKLLMQTGPYMRTIPPSRPPNKPLYYASTQMMKIWLGSSFRMTVDHRSHLSNRTCPCTCKEQAKFKQSI
jgi:hypothetical protein